LPRQKEDADQNGILPHPELNPLLNPVLGEHMGRWAEVYFTAAPEQREEAVLALLRELKDETSAKPTESPRTANFGLPHSAEENAGQPREFSSQDFAGTSPKLQPLEAIEQNSVVCESCGQAAAERQRFCGMCGAPMRGEAIAARAERIDRAAEALRPAAPVPEGQSNQNDIHPIGASQSGFSQNDFAFEQFRPVELDHLRKTVFSLGGNVTGQGSNEQVPYRYRIYVGAALAILIAAVSVMAYRASQDWSGSSHPLPQAAPGVAAQPAAQPAARTDTPTTTVADEGRAQAHTDRNVEAKAKPPKNIASSVPAQVASVARNARSDTPAASSLAANQGNGSEELSIAERYLSGTPGKARDSSEAARWLWQAVSKQNAAASVLLSDLYLKGDGVPKNCDQARLLLDAAARKGAAGAGQRLRNLQAFGCQ